MRIVTFLAAFGLVVACGGQKQPAKKKRVVVTETKVELLPDITFVEGATVADDGHATIEAIATTLLGNPDIELVAVSAIAGSQELSESRGRVIIDELITLGVAATRLQNQPRVNAKEVVEFKILRRASDAAAP